VNSLLRIRLLLGLLVVGLLVPATAHAAPEAGVNLQLPFTANDLRNVQESGAKTARFFVFQSPDLSGFDGPVAELAAIGVKPVFVLVGDRSNPPKTAAAIDGYASFAKAMAQRFRGRSAGFEVWNEPDAPKWWPGMPPLDEDHPDRDASQYVPVLKAAYSAIKSADPAVPVVVGGMTGNDYKFVESIYANGGGDSFDAVATHTDTACAVGSPYGYYRDTQGGPVSQWAFLGYRSVYDVMANHGQAHKQVWITELGWSSHTGPCESGRWAHQKPAGVSEADQAQYTLQAYHCLAADPYVGKIQLFKLNEDAVADLMESKYGAVRMDGTRKPVFNAFKTIATLGDTLPGDEICGDFGGPDITIEHPTEGAVFGNSLPVKATATDPGGVAKVSFFVDGKSIKNQWDKNKGQTLSVFRDWSHADELSLGDHKLTVKAWDASGNESSKSITIRKVPAGQVPGLATTTTAKFKRGKGGKRTIRVYVQRSLELTRLRGKVWVYWQKKKGRRWKTAHRWAKGIKETSKSFTFTEKLDRGRWRVRIVYKPEAGTTYAGSKQVLKFKV
jgi:hypothetical protein